MTNTIIEKTKVFVKELLFESKRPNYPFRSRYQHTLRVHAWVKELHEILGGDLFVLEMAALLHDCDWNGQENHAITSYNTAKEYLKDLDIELSQQETILEAVLHHNLDDTVGLSKESYILMDADELDEVGALSIIWDAMAESREPGSSYRSTYERIRKYSKEFAERADIMHFPETRKIYDSRVKIIEDFLKELKYELKKTD